MASIRARQNAAGFTRWAVLWRDPETRTQQSVTMDYEDEATKLKLLLDANGQSFTAAEKVLAHVASRGPTMDEMFEIYASELTRPSPGTIKKYRSNYRVHLKPMFGSLPVDSIDHTRVVAWIKMMQAEGKSAKTIHGVHAILSAVMKTAIHKKARTDSPCAFIVLPKDNEAGEKSISLTREEYEVILKHTPKPYKLFIEFLVGTGLRFGEATALTFSDFSFDSKPATLRVAKAWKTDEFGRMYLGAPKSKRSRRTVALDVVLAEKIRALSGGPSDRVFLSEKGGHIRSGGFHNHGWKPALLGAMADVDSPLTQRPRPHDLRHTHASWMVQAGVNIFTVSRRLGHESITTTMDRYSHLMPEALADAAEAINRVMR